MTSAEAAVQIAKTVFGAIAVLGFLYFAYKMVRDA